ncbi:hypothetical protein ACFLTH_14715 [Bacteroidota bacterium]
MDLKNHYLVQCIDTAANNLRLSSSKIEMVAILKEFFEKNDKLYEEINRMKQITEFSKFSIKLGQILNHLENDKIDFMKISEKFKEDSFSLVKELSNMLDLLTPELLKRKLGNDANQDISVDLSKRTAGSDSLGSSTFLHESINTEFEIDKTKKEDGFRGQYILDDASDISEFNFEFFEETILKEIKYLDAFLNRLANYNYETAELHDYVRLMKKNAELASKVGFEILYNMHRIFHNALTMVHKKQIAPSDDVIESMRACLIVIVAVVKDKDVDITSYLNRAEIFGRKILGKQKED